MALTQAQLDAYIAQFGGEIGGPGAGRRIDPKTATQTKKVTDPETGITVDLGPDVTEPNLTPNHIIQTRKGDLVVQPLPNGTYEVISMPNVPADPADKNPQTFRPPAAGQPGLIWGKDENGNPQVQVVAGTELPPAREPGTITAQGDYVVNGQVVNTVPGVSAAWQASQQRQAAQDAQAAREKQDKAVLDWYKQQFDEKKWTADQLEKEWQRYIDETYTRPQARQAFNLQLAQEDRANITQAQNYGEKAGSNAVADVVASIPYRFSAGFGERSGAALQAAQSGGFGPTSLARPIAFPNLAQTRGAAQTAGLGVAANQLGIDLPPAQQALAQVPPYGGPPPAGAYAPTPEEDAAEWARRLAGARTRLGPMLQ